MTLPVYVPVEQIAEMAKWSMIRTKRLLKSSGVAVKRGGVLMAPRDKVREIWPEIYQEWLDRYVLTDEERDSTANAAE